MRRVILIIAAAILITGCKVSKEASTVSHVEAVTKADVTDMVNSQSKTNTVVNTIMSYNDSDYLSEDIIITEFSRPDSAGQRYIIKTTKIQRNKTKNKQLSKTDNLKQKVETQTTENKTDKTKINTNQKEKTENKTTVKTKTPGWVYPVSILFALVLFVLIYLILKRYRII